MKSGLMCARVRGYGFPWPSPPGNRCDEHARGQATAPFGFLALLLIGSRHGLAQPLPRPLAARRAATRALDVACASRG
jgi:hypothetical protein